MSKPLKLTKTAAQPEQRRGCDAIEVLKATNFANQIYNAQDQRERDDAADPVAERNAGRMPTNLSKHLEKLLGHEGYREDATPLERKMYGPTGKPKPKPVVPEGCFEQRQDGVKFPSTFRRVK